MEEKIWHCNFSYLILNFPVSNTQLFMLTIVTTGPESTGKTTLACQLAEAYNTLWVPEYARTFLQNLDRPYEERDLLEIAKGQLKLENEKRTLARDFLFCDTDLLVIKVWGIYKYGRSHPWIDREIRKQQHDLYFLCGLDVPWEKDPLRENPNKREREELYFIYKNELLNMGAHFVEIEGNEQERLEKAKSIIEDVFSFNI